jgi:hypothetical protein
MGDAVDQNGGRGARVGPAIEDHSSFDPEDLSGLGGMVTHPDLRRMAMDVAEEGLFASVLHLHGTSNGECEQAAVHLKTDVFSRAERSADTSQGEEDVVLCETEAVCDLLAILVEPLRGDDELHSTTRKGSSKSGLKAEEGLVLHADFVGVFYDDISNDRLVTANDALVTEDVPVRMDGRV